MLTLAAALVLAAGPALPSGMPVAPRTPAAAQAARPLSLDACREAYAALHKADDHDGCVALWRANPHWVTVLLATEVEGAFSVAEAGSTRAAVDARLAGALWGARCAGEAGLPLVQDYVASLCGLDDYRRTLYRQAQRIYERALTTYADGDHGLAATVARESVDRAVDLGDWWGAALAYTTLGECHRELSAFEDALLAFARARTLYRELGLLQDEHEALVAMATMANALEHDVRGLELVRAALALGDRLGALVGGYDVAAQRAELLALRAGMQRRLGDDEAADATRRELEALRTE